MSGSRHTMLHTLGVRSRPQHGDGLSLVRRVLRAPGRPLPAADRAGAERRLGDDFGRVRLHTDDVAAASARAIGARAYAVDGHVVFGRDAYAPQSTAGRQLLTHELSHAARQPRPSSAADGLLSLGRHDDAAERDAEAAAGPGPRRAVAAGQDSPGLVRRSLLGGIVGAIGGAAFGATLGAMVGGPIGAIVGGVIGAIGGALAGDERSTDSRRLTPDEIVYAREVFKDSVDYSKITITRDSMISSGAPKTIGNTIHLKSEWGHFEGDSLRLTQGGRETLVHEMGHVWQYQNGGLAYIPLSLWAQLKASLGSGTRNAAYDWRAAHQAGLAWERWNPEQQAEAIEDYNKLLRKSKDGSATVAELAELAVLLPYMERVWRGAGAPGVFGRSTGRPAAATPTGSTP